MGRRAEEFRPVETPDAPFLDRFKDIGGHVRAALDLGKILGADGIFPVPPFFAVLEDFSRLGTVGKLLQEHDEPFRAGDGTGDAGLPVLVNDEHLDELGPRRRFSGKEGLGENFPFQELCLVGTDDPVDPVVVAVVMEHERPFFRPGDALRKVAPAKRRLFRDGPRRRIDPLPLIPREMPDNLLDEGIVGIVIHVCSPRQKIVEIVEIVPIGQRHVNLLDQPVFAVPFSGPCRGRSWEWRR